MWKRFRTKEVHLLLKECYERRHCVIMIKFYFIFCQNYFRAKYQIITLINVNGRKHLEAYVNMAVRSIYTNIWHKNEHRLLYNDRA